MLNKATIIGNLGRDPEVRTLNNGGKVVNLTVATSEFWKDKQTGERKEKTEWHRVTIWNEGLAGVAEKYLRKGSKVYLEGQLQTRKWEDQQGVERYTTEIVLAAFNGTLKLLDGASGDRNGGERQSGQPGQSGGGNYREQRQAQTAQNFDLDDEIPF